MPITPTNQLKSTATPTGAVKGYAKQGVYGIGVYGTALYGVGVAGFGVPTNAIKSSIDVATIIAVGSPIGLLLSLTYAEELSLSGGIVNQIKN